MTEKRFELKWRDTGEVLYDNENELEHGIYSPDYRFHVRDMMNEFDKENKELKKENEQLKQFIQELATKGTGKIHLANGSIYKVNAILTNIKGDVE